MKALLDMLLLNTFKTIQRKCLKQLDKDCYNSEESNKVKKYSFVKHQLLGGVEKNTVHESSIFSVLKQFNFHLLKIVTDF